MKYLMRGLKSAAVALGAIGALTGPTWAKPGAETHGQSGLHSVVVATSNGRVKGLRQDGMREFLGIPYAAPPVDERRWKPPQPAEDWHGVLKADQFANNCPQTATPFGNASTDEDCLYLNVFTPEAGHGRSAHDKTRPVMVWLHGGAFIAGEGSDYDPAPLVDNGVIVVTLNYRLGLLGFLSTSALSEESADHASGDYGLMDQQAALAWVQRNIANFGGDPDNVTIFGVSAGGLSVLSHMVSPDARDLFDKAIVESGSYSAALPSVQPNLSQAEARGDAFAQQVGCAGGGVDCLRKLPVSTILENQGAGPLAVVPNSGTAVLPKNIYQSLAQGDFNKVPVIEGTNATEWRLFTALAHDLTADGPVTASGYEQAIADSFSIPLSLAQTIAARYPLSAYDNPDLALSAAGTAAAFACPARREINLLASHVPTYAYEFADPEAPQIFVPPVPSFDYGPTHTSEIAYFLDFTSEASLYDEPQFTDEQQTLSQQMIYYWTSFARNGNPNASGGATDFWPQFNRHNRYMRLTTPALDTQSEQRLVEEHNCRFWDAIFEQASAR